ncbi:MAG: flagellar motor protein MotB [Desulfobacteraceae bacterium]|nr:flagellar motor protein MotB [Desulfobacteraceae bacterium]
MTSDTLVRNLRTELEMSERKRLRLQRSRFLKDFEPEDTSLWTMLDLMSLILIFFIMLYTVPAPTATSKISTKTQQAVPKMVKKAVSLDTALPGNALLGNDDRFGNNDTFINDGKSRNDGKLSNDGKLRNDGRYQNAPCHGRHRPV